MATKKRVAKATRKKTKKKTNKKTNKISAKAKMKKKVTRKKPDVPDTLPAPGSGGGPPSGGATQAGGVRIRMYRVGFGDFFLVSVQDKTGGYAHILIDCGVHAADLNSIGAAIDQLAVDTQKQLALVIMTHRHADHISGFARGRETFAQFAVERVWMPWFENKASATAMQFQANLSAVAGKLEQQLAMRAGPGDNKLRNMMTNISSVSAGGSNAVALDVLHGGFKNKAPVDYYKAGDAAILPSSLAAIGVHATILGPPTDPTLIAQMDNKNHQYLSVSDNEEDAKPALPFAPAFRSGAEAYPKDAFSLFDPKTLEESVIASQPDMLAARAQRADNTLNNQSLVVLFEIAGRKLLFAGDAQWGNWSNFLFAGKVSATGQPALTAQSKAILGSLDFYKVGHHGSTNATPIDALDAMKSGLVAMCSTEPGAYGSEEKNSEVPRKPLILALEKKTNGKLAQSTQVDVKDTAKEGDLPAAFEAPVLGVIDYHFT